jgi:uncharacterized RDD family membrane protein YckC
VDAVTETPFTSGPEFAGVFPRLCAVLADLVLMSCVFFPVTRLVKGTWMMVASDHRWAMGWLVTDPLCLIFLVAMFLYFVLLEGLTGATPGKRLLRLRVVAAAGGPTGLPRALVRNVLRIVDGLPTLGILGGILIASTRDRTRVGDTVAGTRVIAIAAARGTGGPTERREDA